MADDNRIEKYRQAAEEIRKLTEGPLQDALKAKREKAEQALRDAQKRLEETRKTVLDSIAHQPKSLGIVNDISFTPKGTPIMEDARIIHKWDDSYGNTVYTATSIKDRASIPFTQIQPLSIKIQAQQQVFGELEIDEQTRIHGEFDSSNGNAESVQQYKDYLANEALGKRFEELKTNPPRPFGNK